MKTRLAKKVFSRMLLDNYPLLEKRIMGKVMERLRADNGHDAESRDSMIIRQLISAADLIESLLNSSLYRLQPDGANALTAQERGLVIAHRKLMEALSLFGVFPMDSAIEQVDYRLHEIVRTVPAATEMEEGRISEVVASGYQTATTVLRRMMVVAKKR